MVPDIPGDFFWPQDCACWEPLFAIFFSDANLLRGLISVARKDTKTRETRVMNISHGTTEKLLLPGIVSQKWDKLTTPSFLAR